MDIGFESFRKRFSPSQAPLVESADEVEHRSDNLGPEWTRLNAEITELNRDIAEHAVHAVPNSTTAGEKLRSLIAQRDAIELKSGSSINKPPLH